MPIYRYQAVDAEGKTVANTVEADTLSQAKQQLSDAALVVFEITEESSNQRSAAKLKSVQKTLWVRQLATLLGAGYTLEQALQSSGRQSQDGQLKAFTQAVHRKVVEGLPFHRVLAQYPKNFDNTFCATVQAGESSGHLDAVLERLAEHAETSAQMRDNIRQALIYPVILTVVASGLITYLMTAVIPDVVKVFSASGQALPAMTQVLLSISTLISRFGPLLVLGAVAMVWWLKRWWAVPNQRYRLHKRQLTLPIVGELIRAYHTANFSGTLAILLNSGVKLVDALTISTQTLSNVALQQTAMLAVTEVQQGKSLAQSLQHGAVSFPGMLLELIDSGERTGKLPEMLSKAAEIYRRQSQSRLQALTSLLAPVMILIMGGLIFAIVLAILLPIFDLNRTIQ